MKATKKPKLITATPDKVVKAVWNYKNDGTEEEIQKLMASVEYDMSAGVLAAREIEKDGEMVYEVMDGNHRLEALLRLGWKKIPLENFGPISKAKAVTIARRRNHSWFDDDLLKLSDLMADVVQEIEMDELTTFMPESEQDLENLVNFGQFDWTTPESKNYNRNAQDDEEEDKKPTSEIPVQKNKINLSIRLDEEFAASMSEVSEKSGYTNLEEFALFCITDKMAKLTGEDTKKSTVRKKVVRKRTR